MSRKRLAFLAQVVVTTALLALFFRKFGWALLQSAFSRTPLWFYLAPFGVLVAGRALYVFKWGLVLRTIGLRLPFWRLGEQYLLGIFFNNFLPHHDRRGRGARLDPGAAGGVRDCRHLHPRGPGPGLSIDGRELVRKRGRPLRRRPGVILAVLVAARGRASLTDEAAAG